jgi:hypothetical protein
VREPRRAEMRSYKGASGALEGRRYREMLLNQNWVVE